MGGVCEGERKGEGRKRGKGRRGTGKRGKEVEKGRGG